MVSPPTHNVVVRVMCCIERVVRLLCHLAAAGVLMWDAHVGNFGGFSDEDVRALDWADVVVMEEPPVRVMRHLMQAGFKNFTDNLGCLHYADSHMVTHREWVPIVSAVQITLQCWFDLHGGNLPGGLNELGASLRACGVEAIVAVNAAGAEIPSRGSMPVGRLIHADTMSVGSLRYVDPRTQSMVNEWNHISRAVRRRVFEDMRGRFAMPSLYTVVPRRRRSDHLRGRSGASEMGTDDYRKVYAVSGYIWEYIQHFHHRHSSQPPPKSFTNEHEFQLWVFHKIRRRIGGKLPTEEELWCSMWAILRRYWAQRRVGFPECGWRGWYFSEHDFLLMECAARCAFSQGFGVVP